MATFICVADVGRPFMGWHSSAQYGLMFSSRVAQPFFTWQSWVLKKERERTNLKTYAFFKDACFLDLPGLISQNNSHSQSQSLYGNGYSGEETEGDVNKSRPVQRPCTIPVLNCYSGSISDILKGTALTLNISLFN